MYAQNRPKTVGGFNQTRTLSIVVVWNTNVEKSRIRETKHLSTDADSSTDTTVGWTKNTQKPNFFEKRKKIIQNAKTQKTSRDMPILAIYPSTRGL